MHLTDFPTSPQIRIEQGKTRPFTWCVAIICTFVTVAVIIVGMVMFIGYFMLKPKAPFVTVKAAHLDVFQFDGAGVLSTKLTIVMVAENDNTHINAKFSNFRYILSFGGLDLRILKARAFEVTKGHAVYLNYMVEIIQEALDPQLMNFADTALNQNRIAFQLNGTATATWRVGPIATVKSCKLNCKLQFRLDGSSVGSRCRAKVK